MLVFSKSFVSFCINHQLNASMIALVHTLLSTFKLSLVYHDVSALFCFGVLTLFIVFIFYEIRCSHYISSAHLCLRIKQKSFLSLPFQFRYFYADQSFVCFLHVLIFTGAMNTYYCVVTLGYILVCCMICHLRLQNKASSQN